ncbi:hypothetical protein UXP39_20690 [Enterobacter sichuanensis]|uniref:hypothetical protein n=1 Tax=Enterobacter sichuanensis TaxID=2071710 RepID=UPI002FD0583F
MSNKYEDLIKNARMNADCGEHMSPEEVTTLLNVVETTFAALAAENAGLKAANAEGCKWDGEQWVGISIETPETEAVLAEVRAQESAPLVRALTVIANSEQHDGETVVCDFDTLISVAAGALRDHYAAQLRKGVQS